MQIIYKKQNPICCVLQSHISYIYSLQVTECVVESLVNFEVP